MSTSIVNVRGIGQATASILAENGIDTVAKLAEATVEQLVMIQGFGRARAAQVIKNAGMLLVSVPEEDSVEDQTSGGVSEIKEAKAKTGKKRGKKAKAKAKKKLAEKKEKAKKTKKKVKKKKGSKATGKQAKKAEPKGKKSKKAKKKK